MIEIKIISLVIWHDMGLGKRDLDRKKKSLENKLQELEDKARKNPLNKQLQEEIRDLKKKIEK
ncbi:MAG: hypothetical protein M1616_05205 [Candidatus Thermoplasmatota archaeon]|nr:hypothetical protein [Candidatus Thermoplasmatota archaeon]